MMILKENSNNNPLVSIITVCYNSEKYIKCTIISVLKQTYNNIEYIIIDGESTDGTTDIIKVFEPRFNRRMKWISEKDNGIYDAMNKGIKLAKGEIIGIINSDDWYEDDTVEVVVNCFKKNSEVELVHGDMAKYNSKDNLVTIYGERKSSFLFAEKVPYSHPTCFVKKEVYNIVGAFDVDFKTAADYDFMLRIIKSKIKTIYVDKVLANFRMVGVTSSSKYPPINQVFKILKKNNYNYCLIFFGILSRLSMSIFKYLFETLNMYFFIKLWRKKSHLHKM